MAPHKGGWFFFAAAFCLLLTSEVQCQGISGRVAPCTVEGEEVAVDHIDKSRCYSCRCTNGFVECKSDYYCPPIEGCHMLVDKTADGCCQKCKGCIFKGVYHESHTEWSDPSRPCTVMRCEAGVITESDLKCYTPCSNPLPPAPGKCCPTCPECKINGQIATEDRDVTSDDPCLKCRCGSRGLTCSKKACPVLQCSERRQYHPPGECCPRCTGTRILMTVPHTCTLQSSFQREGHTFNIDRCTNCTCSNETSVCRRNSCPVLECSPEWQVKVPGSCCKKCTMPEEVRSQCSYGGNVYEDGQSWKLDACSSCKCTRGMPSCAMTRCNVTSPCGAGYRLVKPPGECCAKCEEIEGVCMAFGDPHYKTFDGKIYSFQGVGKYQLVSDCVTHSFSIRVANAFQSRRSSTQTKRVALKVGDIRVNLGQQMRVKVDGTLTQLPYKREGRLQIEKNDEYVSVTLHNGVKILWSGKSFLEITVPAHFKNHLCGLCGNYNGNVQDDFKLRKGGVVRDTEVLAFGNSWCVGQKSKCLKQSKQTAKIRPCKVHKVTKNPCKYLTSTESFNGCDSKLNYSKYYKACIMDMCDCPEGKCYCESFRAYAHECQRLGVNMTGWQKNVYCTANNDRRQSSNKIIDKKLTNSEYLERWLRQRQMNRPKGQKPMLIE